MNSIQGQILQGSQRLFYRPFRKIKEAHSTHEESRLRQSEVPVNMRETIIF